ncbi:MAG TPA: HAD family hydrolase [Acidimicrobiales bacterium]|nr:HAD family hydrolase [Acidimicrobiales bacterium]
MSASAALLDIDGTLVDSNYLHTLSWWRALQDVGATVPMARVAPLIGMGGEQLMTELLGAPDEAAAAGHSRHYQRMKGELSLLPGARELVEALHARGVTVVLATSAKQRELEDLLRLLDADDWIDDVVAAPDVESAKPDPDVFAAALSASGAAAEEALALGDTVWDVKAAGRAGIGCVSVLTGGHCEADLSGAGALAVYRDAAAVLADLDQGPFASLLRR